MPKRYPERVWRRLDRLFDANPAIKPRDAAATMNTYLGKLGGFYKTMAARTIVRARDRFFWFGTTSPWYGHRRGSNRMTPNDVAQLKRIVERDPSLFLDEMAKELKKRTRKTFSTRAIARWLKLPTWKGGLGMTRKVLEERAIERDALARMQYRNAVRYYLARCLVFIDESHKDDRSQRRRRGWSKRGKPAVVHRRTSRGTKYSMLGACDINGMILEACDAVEGTVDSDVFNDWVERRLCPVYVAFARDRGRPPFPSTCAFPPMRLPPRPSFPSAPPTAIDPPCFVRAYLVV